jgi:hypothetical protein
MEVIDGIGQDTSDLKFITLPYCELTRASGRIGSEWRAHAGKCWRNGASCKSFKLVFAVFVSA